MLVRSAASWHQLWNAQYRHTEWSCWNIVQNIVSKKKKRPQYLRYKIYQWNNNIKKNPNIDNNHVVVKNKNRIETCLLFAGVWLWLKHWDYSSALSYIQQTEKVEIKQWANSTFLEIVICLFYTVEVFFPSGSVLQLSGFEVNWPGLRNP